MRPAPRTRIFMRYDGLRPGQCFASGKNLSSKSTFAFRHRAADARRNETARVRDENVAQIERLEAFLVPRVVLLDRLGRGLRDQLVRGRVGEKVGALRRELPGDLRIVIESDAMGLLLQKLHAHE